MPVPPRETFGSRKKQSTKDLGRAIEACFVCYPLLNNDDRAGDNKACMLGMTAPNDHDDPDKKYLGLFKQQQIKACSIYDCFESFFKVKYHHLSPALI